MKDISLVGELQHEHFVTRGVAQLVALRGGVAVSDLEFCRIHGVPLVRRVGRYEMCFACDLEMENPV